MSRKLSDLHPEVHWRAKAVINLAWEIAIPVLITGTLRTFEEQATLYEQGRTKPGNIVTWAKAGESFHNYGIAFDFVPLKDGKPDWKDLEAFRRVGEIGEDLELQWGGRWPKKDRPHLQVSFGFTVHELMVLHSLGGLPRVWQEIDEKIKKPVKTT